VWLHFGVLLAMNLGADVGLRANDWVVVNDTVMGGVSSAVVLDGEGEGLLFEGDLSLERNGGFTSIRRPLGAVDWSDSDGLYLKVAGDGREYLVTVRLRSPAMRRLYYRARLPTERGRVVEKVIPFDEFEAYSFGTRVGGAPPLSAQLRRLGSVGFMLADKNPGPFAMTIQQIATHQSENFEPAPKMGESESSVGQVFAMAIEEGVPLFNAGEPDRCADIYRTAIASVLLLKGETMDDSLRSLLVDALREGRRVSDPSEEAWVYRRAMDRLLSLQP